jgi:hypothetical protein
VTQISAADGSAQAAFITVLVAPSLAAHAPDATYAGLIYDTGQDRYCQPPILGYLIVHLHFQIES